MMIYSVQKTIVEAVLSVVVALMGHFTVSYTHLTLPTNREV